MEVCKSVHICLQKWLLKVQKPIQRSLDQHDRLIESVVKEVDKNGWVVIQHPRTCAGMLAHVDITRALKIGWRGSPTMTPWISTGLLPTSTWSFKAVLMPT